MPIAHPSQTAPTSSEIQTESLPAILITGAILVETVFAWPGIGQLIYQGIVYRDFPVIQAVVLLTAVIVVIVNFGVDITYAYLDPRIRLH
jgi:peptide/nickel transport system permease protein